MDVNPDSRKVTVNPSFLTIPELSVLSFYRTCTDEQRESIKDIAGLNKDSKEGCEE